MTVDEGKSRGSVAGHQHESHPPPAPPPPDQPPHLSPAPPQYGTFQGVPTYPPQHPHQPAMGFPQPAPPPGSGDPSAPPHGQYYTQGYQSVPGYAVADGRPVHEHRLPCCGIGLGWCLFIIGFFLGGIPWYVGAILMICARGRMDYREKPGYIVCTIAAILETVGIIVGATSNDWDRYH